jgi:signal transduction histidine kinase
LTGVTLVITGFIGINLIRSVKKEVEHREKIEGLAKKLETTNKSLGEANEKLKDLDQLKSEFVSLATHQIRAPLAAIKGYLSEIFEGDFGPFSAEMDKPLRTIAQSTENLVHIVGDFLNISRIEQGNMKYDLTDFDLKTIVGDVIKELRPNLERTRLEVKFEAPENSYKVHADINKIKQIVGNLIDNSMKYTPQGSITVALSVKSEAQKIHFSITDTGIGISPDALPRLFQKFSRAKGANEVNVIGTGLGLYAAKLMVEGQGGRVWAESEGIGKGSTFNMELPASAQNK